MKSILLTLLLIITPNLFADESVYDEATQLQLVETIAKEARRDLWRSGHDDVWSGVRKVDLEFLKEHTAREFNEQFEDPLDREEISRLFSCFYRTNCSLYYIAVSSEYYSGYGEEGIFVLINLETFKHTEIRQAIYSE
ncbi:MAG: hypothetical protein ACPGJV_12220 [Bacteriovoracaceae bacterium]